MQLVALLLYMFNWFKRNNKENSKLKHWSIEGLDGFEKIQNTDSIQYTNEDHSKVIYFSILTTSGGELLATNTLEPTIIKDDNGWQLKGMKKFKNQILVCVISVMNQKDLEWAKTFFNSIKPSSNSN